MRRKKKTKAIYFKTKIGLLSLILITLPLTTFIIQQQSSKNSRAQSVPANFLTRNGKTLMLNNQPYKFTGFNAFGLAGCEGVTYSNDDLNAYFSSLQPYSMTRMWATKPWGLEVIDTVVAAAERNNQLLIMSLADGRSNCNEYDGAAGGDGSGKTLQWYQSGYKTNYIPWVKEVVTRYKNSPAIGMWELLNEPGYDAPDTVMKAFFDDTAANIKAIDTNHLVESGSLAEYVEGTTDFAFVHGGPNIDVGSLHEYDYDYQNSKVIESGHFQPALDAMNSINKPLIIGEVGINAANTGCTSFQERSDAFKQKFDTYLSKGAAGILIWNWSRVDHTSECSWWVGPNDPVLSLMRTYQYPGIKGTISTSPVITVTTPITPTFVVIAPCPSCTTSNQTVIPSPTSATIINDSSNSILPTQTPQDTAVPSSITPQNTEKQTNTKANQGIQGLIALLLQFIMKIIAILFGNR